MTNSLIRQIYAIRKRFTETQLLKIQGIINEEVERRMLNDGHTRKMAK